MSSPDTPEGDGAAPFSPGDGIGPYRIEAQLGEGGMGRVYRASGPQGEVALKLIKPALVADPTTRRRFAREARIAEEILHPNVVPVLASGELDGTPYIAQRFVAGGSLAERIQAVGTLDSEPAASICAQVAGGLGAVHAAGLIHRDVKPGNILLDEAGTAYLTDFGLTKDTAGTVLTRPGQALGSIDYMAPEQIQGEPVTPATDVYALGCVLFECVVGRAPFADRQGMRVMWAHVQDAPPDPATINSDVPQPLADAILRALAKDVGERPQTASEFGRVVRAAAGP